MPLLKTLLTALAAGLALLAVPAHAETWPTHSVRLIVPYPPGGSSDNVARLVAEWLSTALGQTVFIENKGGAGATIGTQAAARSAPDGYTLLLAPTAVMAITPHLRSVPYAVGDFIPVANVANSYSIIAARKDLPANNMAEFAALAKKSPGKLTYGSAGVATATHIAGELVHQQMGIQLLHVPYKGSGESLTALLGGQIDVIYDPVALPQARAGLVKVLAVSGKGRHPELPNVLTLKEQGVDVSVGSWFGVFAPKGTPQAIVDKVAAALEKAVAGPGVEKQLATISLYPEFRGPQAFAKLIADDNAAYKEMIVRTGLKVE